MIKKFVFSMFIAAVGFGSISGCSSSADTTVIAPTEDFKEDAKVAEEKAKAMAESQKAPL